ncbi:hypothetical protein DRO54_01385 [Candidatus Bathyarchaeota archaeon]|nr:MAG: hypothetical protein DRO54_01385 [Candidatus Bathyarchaeota archaeon]
MSNEGDVAGYILRITRKEWVKQVFERTKYYVGIKRKWLPNQTILFVHKTAKGDAFIGYGVINNFQDFEELSDEEKTECQKWNWKGALDFIYVVKFKEPLLIKKTFLRDSKLKGRYLHGLALTRKQIDSILPMAE